MNVQTEIENKQLNDCDVTVEQIIYNADKKKIVQTENTVLSYAWDNTFCKQNIVLNNVTLWDIENPYLYSLKTNIYANGKLTYTVTTVLSSFTKATLLTFLTPEEHATLTAPSLMNFEKLPRQ